jgi:DNA-binding NarL/FixJ family response regulator
METILIVDDNAVFRQVLKDLLLSELPDVSLEEVGGSEEALQKASESAPDLILTDIRLHRGSGLDLIRRVKNVNPGVAVIVITDYDAPEYREAALTAGADNFLSKRNSSSREIVEAMRSALAGKGAGIRR